MTTGKFITVKATRTGYYGGLRRREGDVFEVESTKIGSWMEEVKDKVPGPEAKKPKGEKNPSLDEEF